MKVKCIPEDFVVEELTDFPFATSGGAFPFSFYRLEKFGVGTPEAVDAIAKRWNLPRQSIEFGGLKDRHAVTRQHLTIRNGPQRGLKQENLQLIYLGQAERGFGSKDIQGNRFTVVLRDLQKPEHEQLTAASRLLERGVPNYFDDQRFGSLGESGRWIAEPWCKGDFATALWLAIAEANVHDRPEVRQRKQLLRDHWESLGALRGQLERSLEQRIVDYLSGNPKDHRGALAMIRPDLRTLYLSAFQSMLWNRLLGMAIEEFASKNGCDWIDTRLGPMPVPRAASHDALSKLAGLQIPLPAARQQHMGEEWETRLQKVLAPLGLEKRELRVKYPRDAFFSKGERAALFFPQKIKLATDGDDRYPGRLKLQFEFDLPRGAYATIIIKQLQATQASVDSGGSSSQLSNGR